MKRQRDEGAALVVALIIIATVGLLVGMMLNITQFGFAISGVETTAAKQMASAAAAMDTATETVRAQSAGTPVTPACLTTAANAVNGQTGAVTCTEAPGSGAALPLGAASEQPQQAIYTAGSADSTEGLTQVTGSSLRVDGDIVGSPSLTQASGATMVDAGYPAGTACSVSGVLLRAPTCGAAGTLPVIDISWATPTYPAVAALPACATNGLTTFAPGRYTDAATLQTLVNGCVGSLLYFQPGAYVFDFTAAKTDLSLTLQSSSALVGGTLTAGLTTGANALAQFPATGDPTACINNGNGVIFLFAGASRLNLMSGKVQLCGRSNGGAATGNRVAVAALAADANFVTTTPVLPSSATDGGAVVPEPACRSNVKSFTGVASGRVIDGAVATATTAGAVDACTDPFIVGGFGVIPAGTATFQVAIGGSGTGILKYYFSYGAVTTAPVTLATCTGFGTCPVTTYTVTTPTLTAAELSTLTVVVYGYNTISAPLTTSVDGVTYLAQTNNTITATSSTSTQTPYPTSAGATAVLKATGAGAATELSILGTVYVPKGVVDLGLTNVANTVVNRGIIARHVQLSLVALSTYTGPLVSIPLSGWSPRVVTLLASVNGTATLRSKVTYTNGGAIDGNVATVNQWNFQ